AIPSYSSKNRFFRGLPMMSSGCRQLLPALILAGGAAALSAQSRLLPTTPPSTAVGPARPTQAGPRLWWKDEDFRKQLNLSDGQVSQIDKIYKETRPQQEGRMAELNRLETELSVLIKKNDAIEKVT